MAVAVVKPLIADDVKQRAEEVFSRMGLTNEQAIARFYEETAEYDGWPYLSTGYPLPPETLEALREAEEGRMTRVTFDELKAMCCADD